MACENQKCICTNCMSIKHACFPESGSCCCDCC